MQPNVLIVSASAGNGHYSAGEALREAFTDAEPGGFVEHVDILSLAPRWFGVTYGRGFEVVAARAPWVWRQLYHGTDGPGVDGAPWARMAERLLFRAFTDLLRSRPWSAVVCTHFLPAQLLARRSGSLPPIHVVVTDFALHRYWSQPGVERYFTAADHVAAELRLRGAKRAEAFGLPVRRAFAQARSRLEARRTLGLPPGERVALVCGGGCGIGVYEAALAALRATRRGGVVLALCGRNAATAQGLGELRVPSSHLRVLGYRDDVPTLLAAADVVVGKPGGLSCAEALAVGRPLVLTKPIPGHEEGNRDVLEALGVAVSAPAPADLRQVLEHLFSEPPTLHRLAERARAVGRPMAARAIAEAVVTSTRTARDVA